MLSIVDKNHERSLVVLDHYRNFKGIQSIVLKTSKMEEYLSRKDEIIV